MTTERFRFNKFHIDKTWATKFSQEALRFLSQNKEWLYEKLNLSVNDPDHNTSGMDWIIIIDMGDTTEDQKFLTVRTILVSSTSEWYKNYDTMFFTNGDLIRSAVQNMQANNEALKDCAGAIIKGSTAIYDPSIEFPYTKNVWKENKPKDFSDDMI